MSKKVKFHILSAGYCQWCRKAKEAMMDYFEVNSIAGLRGHVTIYDAENEEEADKFEKKFKRLIPSSYSTIPQIVAQSPSGRYKFIGGYSDFMDKYMNEE